MIRRFLAVFTIAVLGAGLLGMGAAQAQTLTSEELYGGAESNAFADLAGLATGDITIIIASLIRTFLGFLGIIATLLILYGGFLYMSSQGEPRKVETAKKVMVNATIGLMIVLSSFAIAQFIVTSLTNALNGAGGINESDEEGGGYDDVFDPDAMFVLQSLNTECSAGIRNVELQFVFSQNVDADSVELYGGIVIGVSNGDAPGTGSFVDGSYTASGKKVFFTPTQTCTVPDTGETVPCFDANTDFEVIVDSAVVRSASGSELECDPQGGEYPCYFEFSTGDGFDVAPPLMSVTSPEEGQSVYTTEPVDPFQALTQDDAGVSTVDYLVDGFVVDTAGLDRSESPTPVGDWEDNHFNGIWDTAGYVSGENYTLTVVGYDCGGNETESDPITVPLRAPNCADPETNSESPYFEDEVNCGGEGQYYCGACEGETCETDGDCAEGVCEGGFCVSTPRIDRVDPGDGAPGNYVTITGSGFGDLAGNVTFVGDPNVPGDDFAVGPVEACIGTWTNTQVIIEVPAEGVDGALLLETSEEETEATNDDRGPNISDFDVNEIVRPGICELDPSTSSEQEATVSVIGKNFGSEQGTSEIYFDSMTATSYPAWGSDGTQVNAVAPLMNNGTYDVQIFVGDGDLREGSNPVEYTLSTSSGDELPVISDVDSGISRCTDTGEICGSDGDCAEPATCEEDKDAGPSGQYVTISGSHFGTSPGEVWFRDATTETAVLGDADFPEVCGEDFWSDEEIVIQVPEGALIDAGSIWIERGDDGLPSDTIGFEVIDGDAGPSICEVDPSAGPPGTEITVYGERFGDTSNDVVFFDNQKVTAPGDWSDELIAGTADAPLQVPEDAQTGPLSVVRTGGMESNAFDFEVGYCDVDFSCGVGTSCCADGACRTTCEEEIPVSHYAYYFSTDDIPDQPSVRETCDASYISPTPWEFQDGGRDVCINAVIGAAFTHEMIPGTINSSTIILSLCTDETCSVTTPVALEPTPESISVDAFAWAPAADLSTSSRYQVTIVGGSDGVMSEDGGVMREDYTFEFVTRASEEGCAVGGVYLTPPEFTAVEQYSPSDPDTLVSYASAPITAEYQCLILACSDYDWTFDSNDPIRATIDDPPAGICSSYARPLLETAPGIPVVISSELSAYGVSDTGDLTINFTDPELVDYWPNCSEACLDADIGGEFNADMAEAMFNGFDGDGDPVVRLFTCEDESCVEDELTEVGVANVDYDDVADTISIDPDTASLEADTWYRVVISSEAESETGVPLSEALESGLNFNGDVSWTFHTKSEFCTIDRVAMSPEIATASVVGERQEFTAVPYGAPDNCSANGQRLDADDFDWSIWASADTYTSADVTYLLDNGEIRVVDDADFPEYCTSSCENAGSPALIAICGDGITGDGEDCDDGNAANGDGCSSVCLTEGVSACADGADPNCCGNGALEGREECDDADNTSGDGCSSVCLNEGANPLGYTCGDNLVSHGAGVGGEECDHGSDNSAYNCSNNCLHLGSVAETDVYGVCGNGGAPESGEDCDDGNTDDNDGCSSSCQNEGSDAGGSTCGDSLVTLGEDCDDGNTEAADGCSSECLDEGSSYLYDPEPWSICTDGGVLGTGESCDATAAGTRIASFGIAQITDEAPQATLEADSSLLTSTITAEADGVSGTAEYQLSCACDTDYSCDATGVSYSCGTGSCCFPRPTVTDAYPTGSEVCLNTAIYFQFDQEMNPASFVRVTNEGGSETVDYNIQLLLAKVGGVDVNAADCATYGFEVASNDPMLNPDAHRYVRLWDWITTGMLQMFAGQATAAPIFCRVPVEFEVRADGTEQRVYLLIEDALIPEALYYYSVNGESDQLDADAEGVESLTGAGLLSSTTPRFETGLELCTLDLVEVNDNGKEVGSDLEDPSIGVFTEPGEIHSLTAAAYTLDGATQDEIQETSGYSWTWSWTSNIEDGSEGDIMSVADADAASAEATSTGTGGEEYGVASVTIDVDEVGDTEGSMLSGETLITALLCENTWPDRTVEPFPFADTDGTAQEFDVYSPFTNFSFWYCRDAADADELLPALEVVEVPTSPVAGIQKELLFLLDDSTDAIGVRVFSNEEYLAPDVWYRAQGFTGSPTDVVLDDYYGVLDGSTYYIAAANQSSGILYPNIYVISFTENSGADAQEIFSQILENWNFNSNKGDVSRINLCKDGSEYALDPDTGEVISCDSGDDCWYIDMGNNAITCDARHAKAARDMRRLTDTTDFVALIEAYGEANGHCSVTTGQSCIADESCPGTEICVAETPTLDSGSYLRNFTTSAWPSWNAVLANELGVAIPSDPLEVFYNCDEENDPDTCWNALEGTFMCRERSHTYIYQSVGGEAYIFATMLEYNRARWAYPIDMDLTDNATIEAGSGRANTPDGFSTTSLYCDGTDIGTSGLCGDGVVGGSEVCEIGQSQSIACDYDGDTVADDGTITVSCKSDCSGYMNESEAETAGAECVPYECGNGIVDGADEVCDDGELNGTYGHCDENCQLTDAFYCGDGSIAGGEQCDCGANDTLRAAGAWSSNPANCSEANGIYTNDYETSCDFDCTFPGPACGDAEVNGVEECDGENETTTGSLCGASDNFAMCETDDDCETSDCGDGGGVCPVSLVCIGGTHDGKSLEDAITEADCVMGGGVASAFEYQTYRSRTCDDELGTSPSCTWNSWTSCLGGEQACGNGEIEGSEACDDGNSDNTDACLNDCTLNVCGDDFVYQGVESCDDGEENGTECDPAYGDTCAYCDYTCSYTVVSGDYCGDGEMNGTELCDADDLPKYCFLADNDPTLRVVGSVCEDDDDCDAGYTCEEVGACDGGSRRTGTNPDYVYHNYNGAGCVVGSGVLSERCGTTNNGAGTERGTCEAQTCTNDCSSACPFDYNYAGLTIETELAGAGQSTSADLYSYLSGESPDTALLYVPACTVGVAMTADIDMSNVIPPEVDIVFVTDLSGSMDTVLDPDTGDSRSEVNVESMTNAIRDLFDAYAGNSAQLQISTVGFTNQLADGVDTDEDGTIELSDACVIATNGTTALAWIDHDLATSGSESDILYDAETGVSTYVDRSNGSTPTAGGLRCAATVLSGSDADEKIVILLSDGDPTVPIDSTLSGTSEYVAEIIDERDDLIADDVQIYTAALTSTSNLIGYMAHFSSDECGNDVESRDDCDPKDNVEYAYNASTADGLEQMYETIITSILGVSVGLTSEFAGESQLTTTVALDGNDVELNFPDGFTCDDTGEFTVPLRVSFNGTGTVNVSDVKLSYCPAY